MDWNEIKEVYIQSGTRPSSLSRTYGADPEELARRMNREGWRALRKDYLKRNEGADPRLLRLRRAADSLLERLEEAIKEMDPYDLRVYKQITSSLKDIRDIQSLRPDGESQKTASSSATAEVVVRVEDPNGWGQ